MGPLGGLSAASFSGGGPQLGPRRRAAGTGGPPHGGQRPRGVHVGACAVQGSKARGRECLRYFQLLVAALKFMQTQCDIIDLRTFPRQTELRFYRAGVPSLPLKATRRLAGVPLNRWGPPKASTLAARTA